MHGVIALAEYPVTGYSASIIENKADFASRVVDIEADVCSEVRMRFALI